MTDEELIARLRSVWRYKDLHLCPTAADRIEALVKEKDQEYKDNIVRMAGQAKDFMEEISTLKARIEALSISNATLIAERDAAEAKLAENEVRIGKAVEALEYYAVEAMPWDADDSLIARTALVDIKLHSDEFATQKEKPMSDEGQWCDPGYCQLAEVSNYAKELKEKLAECEARLAKAVEALKMMCEEFRGYDLPYGSKAYSQATATLVEIKGESHE